MYIGWTVHNSHYIILEVSKSFTISHTSAEKYMFLIFHLLTKIIFLLNPLVSDAINIPVTMSHDVTLSHICPRLNGQEGFLNIGFDGREEVDGHVLGWQDLKTILKGENAIKSISATEKLCLIVMDSYELWCPVFPLLFFEFLLAMMKRS